MKHPEAANNTARFGVWRKGFVRVVLTSTAMLLFGCAHPLPALDRPPTNAASSWLAPGLRYAVLSPWPDSRVHVVQLDLREPGLRLQLSDQTQRGLPMNQLVPVGQALVSANASFFGRGFVPRGHTVSDGQVWAGVLLPQDSPLLSCDRVQRCRIDFEPGADPVAGGFNVVAGTPWLLRGGQARQSADDSTCAALCDKPHPRTALGLDASRRWLTLVLAEGRRGAVVGVRLAALAQWMASLGVVDAINLDGGGSSTLWLRGRAVMDRPFNEPTERALANALHILQVHPPQGLGAAETLGR